MKQLLLLTPLVLIVAVSGCTSFCLPWDSSCGGVVTKTSDVIIIKDLSATPSTISAGQQTRITANIQNQGNTPIENFGPVTIKLFDYCDGLFEIRDIECPDTDSVSSDLSECSIDSMLPQEIRQVSWILVPDPELKLPTTCPQDGMKVFVRYPYITNGLTTITFINPLEYERRLQDGSFTPTQSNIVAGEGPLKAILRVEDQQPIQAWKTDTEQTNIPTTTLTLQIENDAQGFPVSFIDEETGNSYHVNKDNIAVAFPEGLEADSSGCRFASGTPDEHVRLIGDQSPKIICEVKIPDETQVEKETTRTITVEMSYTYEFRKSVKVDVEPTGPLGL